MGALVVIVVVLVVVVRWRLAHRARRRSEAAARQLAHRPLSEWEACYPADRRMDFRMKRSRKRRVGF